jgi:hypothetical protein
MEMKRITAPKFKVGRFVINEYEARSLQVQTALGNIAPYTITIKEIDPKTRRVIGTAQMKEDGSLTRPLPGYAIASGFTIDLIRIKREKVEKEKEEKEKEENLKKPLKFVNYFGN